MILGINWYNLTYSLVFAVFFVLAYFVVLSTNFEKIFKQGQIIAIRIGQVLLALIIAYLVTEGIMNLINSTQFNLNA